MIGDLVLTEAEGKAFLLNGVANNKKQVGGTPRRQRICLRVSMNAT